MRQQMVQQFGGGQQFDPSMLPEELFKDQAERSVRLGLVVREILEKNELKADADKVRARIEEIAEQYEEPQEVINYFYGNPQQLHEPVLAGAKVSEKAVSYEEATRRQQG